MIVMEKQSSLLHHNSGRSYHKEFQVSVDIATLQDFSNLLHSQPKQLYSGSWRRRQIQKVPPQIRRSERLYDPVMVSLGPYHHGKPELRRAEEFKHLCLDRCAGGDDKKKAFFYSKILEEVAAIRDSYAEVTILEKYDDKSLALMMLLDASIIIDFIHDFLGPRGASFLDWQRCLGAGSVPLMVRDMTVMENQIPFPVLKLLISLQYEEGEAASFLPRFITWFSGYKIGMELNHAEIPQEIEDPPLHFLEAFWRIKVKQIKLMISECDSMPPFPDYHTDVCYRHRSVMDLKAKGIRVTPYSSQSAKVKGVAFTPNLCFSQLHLPLLYISHLSHVTWSNMIAFEVSPSSTAHSLVILSYAIFMKSLIQSPEDVKELQERGVLMNRIANLEKVVDIFKEIDTFGLHDLDVFKDVKRRIEEHCSSRAKTWLAELIYTQFQTPWTAIAFFAAVLLLCLSFLQTLFTIRR